MRFALSLLCLLALAVTSHAAETITGVGPKVAVLRLEEVIRNCRYYTARVDVLAQEQNEAKATLKGMEEQMQQLQNTLSAIPKTNERFAKAQEDAEVLKVKMKMFTDRASGNIERRHVAIIREAYATIRSLLKTYSKEHGIQLVQLAPSPELKAPSLSEVQLELGLQSVLYFDDSLDITGDFIQFANAKYAAEVPVDATNGAPLAPKAAPATNGAPLAPQGK
jgi:Skp family chaperone for outer membrane proteins